MDFTKLPLIKNVINKFDKEVQESGFQKALLQILIKTGTNINVINKTDNLTRILKENRVIIVAKHPFEIGILALIASLENRKDLNLIITSSLMNIGNNIDKHLIPVHIYNKEISGKKFHLKLRILKKLYQTPCLSREEEHQKNIKSISLAIEKLNLGGLVTIFPDGGSNNGKWFNGIGYLINGVKDKNNAFVIKASIQGSSNWDYFRILPGFSKLLPKLKVKFSEPILMESYKDMDPKAITANLESDYKNWEKTISCKDDKLNRLIIQTRSLDVIKTAF